MTNEKLIEALKPALDAILELDGCPHTNDIQIRLSKKNGVGYQLEVSSWAKTHRIIAPDLESLPRAVRDYNPADAEKKRKQERLEVLKAELQELETELNPTANNEN